MEGKCRNSATFLTLSHTLHMGGIQDGVDRVGDGENCATMWSSV